MAIGSSGILTETVGSLLKGVRDEGVSVNRHTVPNTLHYQVCQMPPFVEHGVGVDQHESGQMGANTRYERSASKLSEAVVPAIRQHYVVGCLCATVVSNHQSHLVTTAQAVYDCPLALISEAKPRYDHHVGQGSAPSKYAFA